MAMSCPRIITLDTSRSDPFVSTRSIPDIRFRFAITAVLSRVSSKIYSAKIAFRFCALDKDDFREFYPGADIYKKVTLLMNMYVLGSLEYDMEVILAKGQAQTVCLGDPARSEVGLNSWMFSGDRIGELRTLYRA